jgi:hypothetical protein
MAIHTCADCGLIHDAGIPQTSAEVEIARINAESAVRIAELGARADRHIADVQAEAAVDVAHEEAGAVQDALADEEADEHVVDAINAAAAGLADTGDSAPAPMPAPVIQAVDVDETSDAPPENEGSEPPETGKKSRGLGMW